MRVRKDNWQKYFWDSLTVQATKPFEWGQRDCVLFACAVADDILVEPCMTRMAREAFTWMSIYEAAEVLRETTLRDAIESVLGPGQRWQELRMGDLVLLDCEDPEGVFDTGLGVHDGTNPIVAGDHVLKTELWSNVICGWKV